MDAGFWHDKWKSNQIGFHQDEVNRMLARYLDRLGLTAGARVFLPLCGKTRDIAWLLAQGFEVAGSELSELAVRQLFEKMETEPDIAEIGDLKCYSAPGLAVYAGDIFALSGVELGAVDAVYDRAALVALPAAMRADYVAHLAAITGDAPQLLISFDYDQAEMAGPPFSVPGAEIARLYGGRFGIALLADEPVPGKLKGICEAQEQAWLLRPGDV